MTTILILAVAWVALLLWVLDLTSCKHSRLRGVANYYDHDLHTFVHLKECEDCGIALITHER